MKSNYVMDKDMAMANINLNSGAGQSGAGTLGVRDATETKTYSGLEALLREPSLTFASANARGLANTPSLNSSPATADIVVIGRRKIDRNVLHQLEQAKRSPQNNLPPYAPPDVADGDQIVVEGKRPKVEDIADCPIRTQAGEASLDFLYDNSATAKALIDKITASGTKIVTVDSDGSGTGARPLYDPDTNTILYDPFLAIPGTNSNNTTYTEAPVMVLAHEIVHAANPGLKGVEAEKLAMEIANKIAAELNAKTGKNFSTNRDTHKSGDPFSVGSPFSIFVSIVKPGCR
jgi:hypothetical protein